MSKQTYFRQCRMRNNFKDGSYSEQTSYIPEPYCVLNEVLKLRDDDGVWDDGWLVEFVSERRVLDSDLPDIHKEIRGHRKNTGDSEKKH